MSGSWQSPYLAYIHTIRTRLGIFSASSLPIFWKKISFQHFLADVNKQILQLQLPWIQPLESFSRTAYVCENKWSRTISEFRLGCEGLGNKQPRTGYNRKQFCPVCPQRHPNNGMHLIFSCSSLSKLRAETGISSFITVCSIRNIPLDQAYSMFVNGLDSEKKLISRTAFLERAKCMHDMRQLWLTKW